MENEIPMYVLFNKVTIKQLKKQDLCIKDFRINLLYDYSTLENFYSNISDELDDYKDGIEFDNAYKDFMEKAKHIQVFKKYPIRITSLSIKEHINEWYYQKASNRDFDYDVNITDKAKQLLDKLVKEINKHNQCYEVNSFVGYIDLSNELKKYMDKDCELITLK